MVTDSYRYWLVRSAGDPKNIREKPMDLHYSHCTIYGEFPTKWAVTDPAKNSPPNYSDEPWPEPMQIIA
jgi:hypothetical protein